MFLFEKFYAREWVQVGTSLLYIFLIISVPFIYWKLSQKLKGDIKIKFIECTLEIYGVLFFLLIAPVCYIVLYFLGSDSKFILKEPMAWVCFIGGLSSIYDLFRSRFYLKIASRSSCCNKREDMIIKWQVLTKIALYLSFIPSIYGAVMIGITNLIGVESIYNILWFLTFLITGWSIVYAIISRYILLIAQASVTNSN